MMPVNYGYNWANWNLAAMSAPTIKLGSYRGIVVSVDLVRGPDAPSYVPPVPVTVTVTYVDTAGDPWVRCRLLLQLYRLAVAPRLPLL